MNKNRCTLLFACIFIMVFETAAQKIAVSFSTEYGGYAMKELRDFQDVLKRDLPVSAKNVHSFPSYWGYGGKLYYIAGRFEFGFTGGLNSTGARTSYGDYSGSIQFDHLAKLIHFGAGCNVRISKHDNPWHFLLGLQTELGKTKYSLRSFFVLGDETVQDETHHFKASNVLIHPSMTLSRTLLQRLVIAAQAGFVLDSSSDLVYTEDTELYLLGDDNQPITSNWSGFRLALSVGVKL